VKDSQSSIPLASIRRRSPSVLLLAVTGAALMWLAQPPLKVWPIAWVALVPWILLSQRATLTRRSYGVVYLVAFVYWALTMQGLRHAHPALYAAWLALAAYLAAYPILWIWLVRSAGGLPHLFPPLWFTAPAVWVGLEWVRNHLLTGISAVMLGHTQADVAAVIQIADLFGSYGVSFVVALVNTAVAIALQARFAAATSAAPAAEAAETSAVAEPPRVAPAVAVAATVLGLTLGYGVWRIREAESQLASPAGGDSPGVIALIGRDEPIVFEQDFRRELEIFRNYSEQTLDAAKRAAVDGQTVAAVVWPESMFSGAIPHVIAEPGVPLVVPPGAAMGEAELQQYIDESQLRFRDRAAELQQRIRQITGQATDPELVVGCSVVRYSEPLGVHCGCVQIAAGGRVVGFYAKNHLVMFGEYIPGIEFLPWIERWIPPGMGVTPGAGPVAMQVGDQVLSPNVCIETAVERVTLNQIRELLARGEKPTQIVNVTNDGWFDRTSVVEHHLRCAQLVAVGTRRPVLIAANGGPTAWIDSSGQIVERLRHGEAGSILVTPRADGRAALYLTLGDWPAALLALFCVTILGAAVVRHRRERTRPQEANTTAGGDRGALMNAAQGLTVRTGMTGSDSRKVRP
jgi:apolipoprotein N-acyltransferase